jgi:hypothetical protein
VTPIPSAISIDAFSFNNISTILKCPFVDASIKAVFPFCPLQINTHAVNLVLPP